MSQKVSATKAKGINMKKFIKKMEIKKFKSLNGQTFDFSENLNIITGANGSGKTTLLESIAYITGSKLSHNPESRPFNNEAFEINIESSENSDRDFDIVLLDNFGNDIPQPELASYINAIKDKYQDKQIFAVSNQDEIINMADNVISLS